MKSHQNEEDGQREEEKLRQAARDMIFGYKLSGMNNPNILALLLFALAELVLDRDSSPELVQLIQSEMSPSNPPPAAPER